MKKDDRQLLLPFLTPKLRVLQGGREARPPEALNSKDAVARVLIEAGADMLLKRISSERAELIEVMVDEVLMLFDKVDATPWVRPVLEKKLDALEALMRETREVSQSTRLQRMKNR